MQKKLLNTIIDEKRKWIQKRKERQPLSQFQYFVKKSTRKFRTTLKKFIPFFILECKKYSPTHGKLNANFNLKNILNTYKNYATAVSILTDEKYFKGKFEYLLQASKIIKQPILCKDFFIDPYQIFLARYYQADAILLILSILNDNQYIKLSKVAKLLNMDIITEINNVEELQRAILLKANIIGINNRNLNDLSVDINKTKIIAPMIPKNILIISESGISTYNEIRELNTLVHGFLIGSSLMKSNNLTRKIKSIIFGNNKICGLTNLQDAALAYNYGAIYGGLIFIKSSCRYISKSVARKITNNTKLQHVAVFQNEDIHSILSTIQNLHIFAIQLHGEENQSYINKLQKHLPPTIKIWKAIPILNQDSAKKQFNNVQRYVFDNQNGGSGKKFNWCYIKNYNLKNVILAGGINEKNCISASKIGFFGLDINSGIEKRIGIKDEKKLLSIFKKLRYHQ